MRDETANNLWTRAGLIAGILAAVVAWSGPSWGWQLASEGSHANRMAGITLLMSIWWITEAVPIAVTALVPIVLFPMGGIMTAGEVAPYYADANIFLYLGGIIVALAVEESGLHKRIALLTVLAFGDKPAGLVAGFMVATGALSMWTSNTATTMLMLPIALSVLSQSRDDDARAGRLATTLLLGIAYAASIGGTATLIGTPTNVVFRGFVEQHLPGVGPIGFAAWMALATPFAITFLIASWFVMTRFIFPLPAASMHGGREVILQNLRELGPMRPSEWRMAAIFSVMALLWIFREPVPGWGWAPVLGWGQSAATGFKPWVDDGTVAMTMAVICFLTPSGEGHRARLITWETTRRLPWGVVLLFGGGFSLAGGMTRTSLDRLAGEGLGAALSNLSPIAMASTVAVAVILLTELTSNVACLSMILPVLATAAAALDIDPLLIMVPATISSSCGFMLPAGTPPNSIVYSSGHVRTRDMVWAGIWLDLLGALWTVAFVVMLGPVVFGLRW
jgi:sodium-dependent dicarboxylate transporter 2/3/5